nr:Chain B, peptide AASASA [synthetic construct]
AASASA